MLCLLKFYFATTEINFFGINETQDPSLNQRKGEDRPFLPLKISENRNTSESIEGNAFIGIWKNMSFIEGLKQIFS